MLIYNPATKFLAVRAGLVMDNLYELHEALDRIDRAYTVLARKIEVKTPRAQLRRSSSCPRVQEAAERRTGDATPD